METLRNQWPLIAITLMFIVLGIASADKGNARPVPLAVWNHDEVVLGERAVAMGVTLYRTTFECLPLGTSGPLSFTKGGKHITISGDFATELVGKYVFLTPTANCLSDELAPVVVTFDTPVSGASFAHTQGASFCCRNDVGQEFCSPPAQHATNTGISIEGLQECTVTSGSIKAVNFF